MRIAKVPLSYDVIGFNSRSKRREEKLKQLFDE
jgi:hypothetical protein